MRSMSHIDRACQQRLTTRVPAACQFDFGLCLWKPWMLAPALIRPNNFLNEQCGTVQELADVSEEFDYC